LEYAAGVLRSNVSSPDITVAILKGTRERLLLAPVTPRP
jgi:hypothetical protein